MPTVGLTMESERLERVTRRDWLAGMGKTWKQGQHLAILGPTGSGKTYLQHDLLALRQYVAVLCIKREDDTLRRFHDYHVTKTWPPLWGYNRVLFKPKMASVEDIKKQRAAIIKMLRLTWISGGWTVDLDDLSYMCELLRIRDEIVLLFNQGRALGITGVSVATRPTGVPRAAFNQCTHVLTFRFFDEDEHDRAGQISGIARKRFTALQDQLQEREFLYVRSGTNQAPIIVTAR